jgi:hypothetical protein
MTRSEAPHPLARVAILQWTARLGAVTAEALADHEGATVASARARLLAAVRAGLISRSRPLQGQPALFTLTRAGLRASGLHGLEPSHVSTANAAHAIACASVAAALERSYPDHRLLGERELRRDERECGAPLASAVLGSGPDGAPLLHRPDLVLWPEPANETARSEAAERPAPAGARPVAVEVELTVKAPRRLLEICRAWARCRCVAGVLYLVAPEVGRPLARAVDRAQAGERIVLVSLEALAPADGEVAPIARTVPGDA